MKNRILANLNKAVIDLKRVLDEDVFLDQSDRLFIENHLMMLQAAYTTWKTRNPGQDSEYSVLVSCWRGVRVSREMKRHSTHTAATLLSSLLFAMADRARV